MNFKLDENFGTRTQMLFREAGHAVQTVHNEGLSGATDEQLYELCCAERLCLVTLDLDFSEVLRFPPANSAGIVVIRVPRNPSLVLLERLVGQFLKALTQMSVERQLWIIEVGRVRVHQSEASE